MTIPSNTWMRSLSPSRTLTCTRTVSPDLISGRSTVCICSTVSIAPIFGSLLPLLNQLANDVALLGIEFGSPQQFRPPLERAPKRLAAPPAPDLAVVPRQQDSRHLLVPELGRPRVLGKVEQPSRKRVCPHRLPIANHPRNEASDRVDHDKGRQFTARQHVV